MVQSNKPYSYHVQLLLLRQALDAVKRARGFLDQALSNEAAELGPMDAEQGDYGLLAEAAEELHTSIEDHISAVLPLAELQPPDPVEPRDPTDYSQDERFHQMIDHAFDVAVGHGVEPEEVVSALGAAVAEGDQR